MGYFDKFKNNGIPFMDGREKGDLHQIIGEKVHIDDFGFINGENGEYAVISTIEYPQTFFFCNAIITEMLRTVQADEMESALAKQEIAFVEMKSRRGREYMTYVFD